MTRPQMVVCFTGHRPDKIGNYHENAPVVREVKEWLEKHIRRIVERYESVTFITGGALGVDTWAFEIVHRIRTGQYKTKGDASSINNVLILPCVEHYAPWPQDKQAHARHMIDYMATHVYYADSNRYKGGWQMQKRNQLMVDKSDGVIAVWNESEGGTANCVDYAIKKGVPILGYNHDRKKQFSIK